MILHILDLVHHVFPNPVCLNLTECSAALYCGGMAHERALPPSQLHGPVDKMLCSNMKTDVQMSEQRMCLMRKRLCLFCGCLTDCCLPFFSFTLSICLFLFSVLMLSCASPLSLPSSLISRLSINTSSPPLSSFKFPLHLIPFSSHLCLFAFPPSPFPPPLPSSSSLSPHLIRSLSQGSTNSNMLDVQGGAHKKRVRRSSLLNAKKLYEDAQMARKVKQYLSNLTVETDEEKHQIMSLQCEPSYSTCEWCTLLIRNFKYVLWRLSEIYLSARAEHKSFDARGVWLLKLFFCYSRINSSI